MGGSSFRWLMARRWRHVILAAIGLLIASHAGATGPRRASAQGPTCVQPRDQAISHTICEAAHDEIAGDYPAPLFDTHSGGYIPPIILKAIGGWESDWLQCRPDGTPVSSANGCAWGLMQINSGMNCAAPQDQFNAETQQQVRYDYRYSVAMGAHILKRWKWDWQAGSGRVIGDGDPSVPEHWYYAVWAYGEGGWSAQNSPNNQQRNPCNGWPDSWVDCAYQDRIWWQAAHPDTRDGRPLWSAVHLTRPDPSLFPEDQAEMDTWTNWAIPDPLPLHQDFCRVELPIILKNWPPYPEAPVLNPIANPANAPDYAVTWQPAYLATSYTLQEATDDTFALPVTRYSGLGTSWQASGQAPGIYYYRVKATNSWGDSSWSETQQTAVGPLTGWIAIASEGFEGAFPGPWQVYDGNGATGGEYYWDNAICRAYQGSWGGWAVGGGLDGDNKICWENYPNDADSWMVYGPFTLQGALQAELGFKLWLSSERDYDWFEYRASPGDGYFYGWKLSGDTQGWQDRTFDLANVPGVGSLLGLPQVWVALRFVSDGTVNLPEGAYVDNVIVRKCLAGSCPAGGGASIGPGGTGVRQVPVTRVRGP